MSNDYTPDTEQVRRYWQYGANAWFDGVARDDDTGPDGSIGAEFDRWLAGIKADAWDEGHDAATDEAPDGVWPDAWIDTPNPYRQEADR